MERTLSSECKGKIGKKVLIKGWIYNVRNLGSISFLILKDRKGLIQIVVADKKEIAKAKDFQIGTVVEITGTVQATKQQKSGAEIIDPKIEVLSLVTEAPPVEYNKDDINANLDTILDYRPITLRNIKEQSIFKIQSRIVKSFRDYMDRNDFVEHFAPTLVEAATEGGAELFSVNYFDTKALLAQSGQLYKQMAAGVFERTYALGHTYRAEKFATRRHLTEFIQYEVEMAFIDSWTDLIENNEGYVRYMMEQIKEKCRDELDLLGVELPIIPKEKFPRIKIKDALKICHKRTGKDETKEPDLSPENERELCKYAKEEFGSDVIYITHYYTKKRPFYTMRDPENPEETLSFDLLMRESEVTTGGQRMNKYDMLVDSIKEFKLKVEDYKDYLQIFKYGMPPEGGWAMGLERLTQMVLGFENIRRTTLFPRDVKRLSP